MRFGQQHPFLQLSSISAKMLFAEGKCFCNSVYKNITLCKSVAVALCTIVVVSTTVMFFEYVLISWTIKSL
jgi:hypothetical protein